MEDWKKPEILVIKCFSCDKYCGNSRVHLPQCARCSQIGKSMERCDNCRGIGPTLECKFEEWQDSQ